MMIKLADLCEGSVDGKIINKALTETDWERLRRALSSAAKSFTDTA
jgi:hypothetical protein